MTQESDSERPAGDAEPDEDSSTEERRDRKERVLHTRVPAVLEKELKRLATSLRMPVSNVVRAILEDAVDKVDDVGRKAEGEVRGLASRVGDRLRSTAQKLDDSERPPAKPGAPPLAGVVGFQPMLLARPGECALCGRTLLAGEEAFLGLRSRPDPRPTIVGRECLPFPARPNEP